MLPIIFSFDYNFSYDNNFKSSNYDSLSANINYKCIITNFNFLSEDGNIGDNEVFSNSSNIKFLTKKSMKFNITKDLKR